MISYEKLILLGIMVWQENRVLKQQDIIKKQSDYIKSCHEQLSYLCSILNKHEIRLDEFDYIALPNIKPKSRAENTD